MRGESVSFWDGFGAWRGYLVPALAAGAATVLAATVFWVNVLGGMAAGDPIGWGFATFAGWGLLAMALLALTFWPLLADPRRRGWGGPPRAPAGGLPGASRIRCGWPRWPSGPPSCSS